MFGKRKVTDNSENLINTCQKLYLESCHELSKQDKDTLSILCLYTALKISKNDYERFITNGINKDISTSNAMSLLLSTYTIWSVIFNNLSDKCNKVNNYLSNPYIDDNMIMKELQISTNELELLKKIALIDEIIIKYHINKHSKDLTKTVNLSDNSVHTDYYSIYNKLAGIIEEVINIIDNINENLNILSIPNDFEQTYLTLLKKLNNGEIIG